MPRSRFAGSLITPKVDVIIDMGNPFLNHSVDAFLKIGTVAATKTAAEETYEIVKRGSVSNHNFEKSVICEEGFAIIEAEKAQLGQIWLLVFFAWCVLYHGIANLEDELKKMCKEGAYWGTVAGVYAGIEYGTERIRGTRDWKNAMIGGALTGALISAASNNNRDKIVMDAITGGAVATAAEFLNYLT